MNNEFSPMKQERPRTFSVVIERLPEADEAVHEDDTIDASPADDEIALTADAETMTDVEARDPSWMVSGVVEGLQEDGEAVHADGNIDGYTADAERVFTADAVTMTSMEIHPMDFFYDVTGQLLAKDEVVYEDDIFDACSQAMEDALTCWKEVFNINGSVCARSVEGATIFECAEDDGQENAFCTDMDECGSGG